jgi:NADPH2:quinone reductase
VRAWQVTKFGEPRDALQLAEIDEPTPGPGELRLRVEAAAVGLPDVFMCRATYAYKPPVPFVPGQEVCGIVDAVGEGVDVPVGSRVMGVTSFYDGRGGFAERTIVPVHSAFRVPETMAAQQAAAFRIGYSTAWRALVRRGELAKGEELLVIGASGGSGTAAVQLGAALGARVIAVASSPDKQDYCRQLGADVVLDRRSPQLAEDIRNATGGRGPDVVFDPAGGEVAQQSLDAMAIGGRFLAVGFASGTWVQAPTHQLVIRNQSLVGVLASGLTAEENDADHEALLALAAGGTLDMAVTVVPFEQVPEAVEAVAVGTVQGKMVAMVSERSG